MQDPPLLDLDFDFSGIETYDVAGWPDAQKYLLYTLEFSLIKITQTYPDGSIELGDTVGTITANAGFDNDGEVSVGTEVAIVEADFGNSLELVNVVVRDPVPVASAVAIAVETDRFSREVLYRASAPRLRRPAMSPAPAKDRR